MSGISQQVYYDQLTNQLIDGTNVSSVISTNTYAKLFRNNEHVIIRANVYSDASTSTFANLAGLTLSAKIGTVGTTALMTANNASFNQTADWSMANASAGKICFYVNTSGTAVDTALGTVEFKNYACNINGNDISGDDITVAQFNIQLKNTPD